VTNHQAFATREASLRRLNWRNSQYLFYADWLQFQRFEAKAVLDFGCGPGDDLVALQEFSKPDRLVGVDVSAASVEESKRRLACHAGKQPEIRLVDEGGALPFDAGSFDFVIASGVLHHVFDLRATLSELYRVLKPGGVMLAMIYNRESVWAHLYVPYMRQLRDRVDSDLTFEEAFKRSTDGPSCPKSMCFEPEKFEKVVCAHGFSGGYTGAAVSIAEMEWLPERLAAIQDPRLPEVDCQFLARLSFDEHGRPLHEGRVAGIDGFYEFVR
jgi:SAM-dependent methyltransferase